MWKRVQANCLKAGDIIGSGETIVRTSIDLYTPKGKIEVVICKGDKLRTVVWGKYTLIGVSRKEVVDTV